MMIDADTRESAKIKAEADGVIVRDVIRKWTHIPKRKGQKVILLVAASVLAINLLFPPWVGTNKDTGISAGYAPIFLPPKPHRRRSFDGVASIRRGIFAILGTKPPIRSRHRGFCPHAQYQPC